MPEHAAQPSIRFDGQVIIVTGAEDIAIRWQQIARS
jgi:hypothetical protein